MQVADFMTPRPYCVDRREPLMQLMEVFEHHGIFQVPVVDESNALVGIISDQDVRRVLAAGAKTIPRLIVEDVMTPKPVTVTPATPITDAIDILCESRFGALPVVVGSHVVGILCARDLLKRYADRLREPSQYGSAIVEQAPFAHGTRA